MHVLSSFSVAVESLIDAINIHCVFSLQVNATSPGLKYVLLYICSTRSHFAKFNWSWAQLEYHSIDWESKLLVPVVCFA
jgi:hypothetical protein